MYRASLLARVRWDNVAKLAATVSVAAVVVAWPRLEPPAPEVPEGRPRPLAAAPRVAPPVVRRPPRVGGKRRLSAEKPRPRLVKRVGGKHRPPAEKPRPTVAVAPADDEPAPAPPPAPAPLPPSAAAIAETEFGLEP